MSYVIAAGTIGLAGARMLVDAAVSDAQSRDLRVCVAVTMLRRSNESTGAQAR